MLYCDFQGMKLSMLGFGAMRLPLLPGSNEIDEAQVAEMTRYAIENGVNYFDTAYPYHGGKSERVIGNILKAYPRESFYLADKYPGHQISDTYDPKAVFEEQLEKCGVDYFDFYLLHNVCESSMEVYLDPQWGIIDYFIEQKKRGRIKHLGFSTHARPETLRGFLERYAEHMEFCQIQLNYLDWTLQDAKTKCDILAQYQIPVWVMEPLRGGKLATLPEACENALKALRPDESIAAWAFRWLQSIPNVAVILSGMSNLEQMRDNIRTFSERKPLSEQEIQTLTQTAERLKNALPCTGCRYCCDGCPMGLDIPLLIAAYNDVRFESSFTVAMQMDALPQEKLPSACIGCGACSKICPQGIDIPKAMSEFAERMKSLPNWEKICRERAEAAKADRG